MNGTPPWAVAVLFAGWTFVLLVVVGLALQ